MEYISKILKALSDKNRLRIVALLSKRKMCVCELASVIGVTQPSISRHLKKMKKAGLIEEEQDGFWTNYYISVKGKKEGAVMGCIKTWVSGDQTVLNDIKKLKKINRKKLCCK